MLLITGIVESERPFRMGVVYKEPGRGVVLARLVSTLGMVTLSALASW